ncbi:MAG: TerL [Chloroflexi bacterium]|nr:TerL [Chloroflexota bacterium]
MPSTLRVNIGATRYPVLNEFMGANHRVDAIMGPLGSGKTYGAIQRLLRHMCEQAPNPVGQRPTRFYAVRNTYPDLMSTTVKDFIAVFAGMGIMKMGSLEPPTYHVHFRLEDGTTVKSEVIFLSLDREDDVRKLRGSQATGFWLNEMKELVKAVVDMADLRHGRYPSMADGGVRPTWHGMIGDTNAPDEDHWYYKLAEEDRPQGWHFHRQPGGVYSKGKKPNGRTIWGMNDHAENLENLPEAYYERGIQAKEDDWIAVMLSNEYGFVSDGKPVYPEFTDSFHVTEWATPLPGVEIRVGLDFGLTPACVFLQQDVTGRWRAIDELCSEDMGIGRFSQLLNSKMQAEYRDFKFSFFGDPAGDQRAQTDERTPFMILAANGISAIPARTNDFNLRREAVADPLMRIIDGKPQLAIHPKCRQLRKGMAGKYCYKRVQIIGDERYHDKPDKGIYSHVCEALQYVMLESGSNPTLSLAQQRNPPQPFVVAPNWSPFDSRVWVPA